MCLAMKVSIRTLARSKHGLMSKGLESGLDLGALKKEGLGLNIAYNIIRQGPTS